MVSLSNIQLMIQKSISTVAGGATLEEEYEEEQEGYLIILKR